MIPKHFLLLFIAFLTCNYGLANPSETKEKKEGDIKTEIKEFVFHHLKDSHSFGITSYENKNGEKVYVEIPLPVILYDNGFHFFMSSDFKHGKKTVNKGEQYYALNYHDNKIYKTGKKGILELDESHKVLNEKPIDLSITKNVVVIIITAFLMLWLFVSLAKSYKKNNGISSGIGRFFEPVVLYVRDEIARPNIGEKHYRKYMSFLLTIFFFV